VVFENIGLILYGNRKIRIPLYTINDRPSLKIKDNPDHCIFFCLWYRNQMNLIDKSEYMYGNMNL